jgi:hypothetical protein
MQTCMGNMMKDTAATAGYRKSMANLTLKEVFEYKDYFLIYYYQHCNRMSESTDELVLNITVRETYYRSLQAAKLLLGHGFLRMLRQNKMDSLALVFPQYKQYGAALKKVAGLAKNRAIKAAVYFNGLHQRTTQEVMITFEGKNKSLGYAKLTTQQGMLSNKITKLVFEKPPKDSEEIIEDRVIEIKTGQ